MIALGICLGIGVALYLVAYALTRNADLSKALASLPLLAVTKVAEALQQRLQKSSKQDPIIKFSFGNFTLSNLIISLSCVALVIVTMNTASILAAMATAITFQLTSSGSLTTEGMITGSGIFVAPITILCLFLIGRWAGVHGGKHSAYAMLLGILTGFILCKTADFTLMSEEVRTYMKNSVVGDARSMTILLAAAAVAFCAVSLVGYWRGRSVQRTVYIQHLMKLLPGSTRDTFLDMIHHEAQALPRKSG